MPTAPHYPVPALEKGLDIVEALAAAAVPQSLADLAATLDRSSSELFRMLNCLERRGYVRRDPVAGKYGLSLKLFALAHGHAPTEKLVQAARAPMQALTEAVRESCHLSVLDAGRLLVIAQEESPEQVRISIEVGGVFDPSRTASGRLLLAHEQGAPRPAAWARMLETIRREGVSVAESETVEGVQDHAVLVGAPERGVTAALAVTRLKRKGERLNETKLLNAMRRAAREITSGLGFS